MKYADRAKILKAIADKRISGSTTPVTDTAQAGEFDNELVWKSARQAGYKVMKRKGMWYETPDVV